mgnify:CR=1 FL=1
MGKTIGVWVSDEEYESIKTLAGGNVSNYLKQLLVQGIDGQYERVESETSAFKKLLEKIEEITAKGNGGPAEISEDGAIILKYLKQILGQTVKANIAIEELAKRRLARSDIFADYLQAIEQRLIEKQQGG